MVRGQKIPYENFRAMGQTERDRAIIKAYGPSTGPFGITEDDLRDYRSLGRNDPWQGLQEAALGLYKASGETPEERDIACVNMGLVSNMAFECDFFTGNFSKAARLVKKLHGKRRRLLHDMGLKASNIYFVEEGLRDEFGNLINPSNLIEVKTNGLYPEFTADKFDFIRGIKLPEKIDREVSQLLGVIWSSGSVNVKGENYDSAVVVSYKNDEKRLGFYSEWLNPKMKELFNITPGKKFIKVSSTGKDSSTWVANSRAFVTWYRKDLGLGSQFLPSVEYDEQGFVEGVMANRPSIYSKRSPKCKKTYVYLDFSDNDKLDLEDIRDVLLDAGYRCGKVGIDIHEGQGYERSKTRYVFTLSLLKKNLHRTELINPYHRQLVDSIDDSMVYDVKKRIRGVKPPKEATTNVALAMIKTSGKLPSYSYLRDNGFEWMIKSAREHFDGFRPFRQHVEELYTQIAET